MEYYKWLFGFIIIISIIIVVGTTINDYIVNEDLIQENKELKEKEILYNQLISEYNLTLIELSQLLHEYTATNGMFLEQTKNLVKKYKEVE